MGEIDWNAELACPVEQSIMVGWEQTMNAKTNELLRTSCADLKREGRDATECIRVALEGEGLPAHAVGWAAQTAARKVELEVERKMVALQDFAMTRQRNINRQLQPQILEHMKPGYAAAYKAPAGKGRFDRMKTAVGTHADQAMKGMFEQTTTKMCAALCMRLHHHSCSCTARSVPVPSVTRPGPARCRVAQAERDHGPDPRAARPDRRRLRGNLQDSRGCLLGVLGARGCRRRERRRAEHAQRA